MTDPARSLRQRLERASTSDDPDTRQQAKALLSILALYENDPYQEIPANWIYGIMARHLIKDEDVIRSVDTRTLPSRRVPAPHRDRVPPAHGPDQWDHRDHIVGDPVAGRHEDHPSRPGDPAPPRG